MDYDTFAAPHQKKVVSVKRLIRTPLSSSTSPAVLGDRAHGHDRVDIVSLDRTVDMAEVSLACPSTSVFRARGSRPSVRFPEAIEACIEDCVRKARGRKHILNLGHGILPGTPEENGAASSAWQERDGSPGAFA